MRHVLLFALLNTGTLVYPGAYAILFHGNIGINGNFIVGYPAEHVAGVDVSKKNVNIIEFCGA